MRVVCFAAGNDASAEYRIKMPAQALANQGADVVVGDPLATGAGLLAGSANVLVINRPHNPGVIKMIQDAQNQGIAVVVDLDDDFDTLTPAHSVFARAKAFAPVVHAACQAADLVTVTTPGLFHRYQYGHGALVPNCIAESLFDVEGSEHDDVRAGWTGTVASHPHDLEAAGNGIRRALGESDGSSFLVVGPHTSVAKQLGIKSVRATGFVPFADYFQAYAEIDVPIVPLAPTIFNDHKSALKGLEAAALGKPFVASPVAEYRTLGMGQLARYPSDWRFMVGNLLRSEQMRADLGGRNRELAHRHTVEANCGRWMDAWRLALLNRRSVLSPA